MENRIMAKHTAIMSLKLVSHSSVLNKCFKASYAKSLLVFDLSQNLSQVLCQYPSDAERFGMIRLDKASACDWGRSSLILKFQLNKYRKVCRYVNKLALNAVYG
ncbi:hypothetical protein O9992_10240 [Vibrio lentus]|nr:hypothetical protein [Vibrio lentus]